MGVSTRQPSNQFFVELKNPEVSRRSDSDSWEGQRVITASRKKEDDMARVHQETGENGASGKSMHHLQAVSA